MPRRRARSIPAICTIGGLTMRGPVVEDGCIRIASTSGLIWRPLLTYLERRPATVFVEGLVGMK